MSLYGQLPNSLADDLVSNAISSDLTGHDLGHGLTPQGRGGMLIQFFWSKVKIDSADPVMNGTVQDRLCIAKMPKGDRFTCSTGFISEADAQRQFPREYALFRESDDVPTTGTPLHELPGMSQSQIGILVINGLRSIEDLAMISDDAVSRLGIDVRAAKNLAVRWMNRKTEAESAISAASAEAALKAQLDARDMRMAALEAETVRLRAQVEAFKSIGSGGGQQAPQSAPMMMGNGAGSNTIMTTVNDGFEMDDADDPFMRGPGALDGLGNPLGDD